MCFWYIWVHSSVVRAADCRSAGPWFKSGCALLPTHDHHHNHRHHRSSRHRNHHHRQHPPSIIHSRRRPSSSITEGANANMKTHLSAVGSNPPCLGCWCILSDAAPHTRSSASRPPRGPRACFQIRIAVLCDRWRRTMRAHDGLWMLAMMMMMMMAILTMMTMTVVAMTVSWQHGTPGFEPGTC